MVIASYILSFENAFPVYTIGKNHNLSFQMINLSCREFNLPKIPCVVVTVTEDTDRISRGV